MLFVGPRRSWEERDGGAFVDNIRQGRPLACDTLGGFDTGLPFDVIDDKSGLLTTLAALKLHDLRHRAQ